MDGRYAASGVAATDVNKTLWKYGLPLLATLVAASVSITLQPPHRPPGQVWSTRHETPHRAQTVASSARPPPTSDHCGSTLDMADLDDRSHVCSERTD